MSSTLSVMERVGLRRRVPGFEPLLARESPPIPEEAPRLPHDVVLELTETSQGPEMVVALHRELRATFGDLDADLASNFKTKRPEDLSIKFYGHRMIESYPGHHAVITFLKKEPLPGVACIRYEPCEKPYWGARPFAAGEVREAGEKLGRLLAKHARSTGTE